MTKTDKLQQGLESGRLLRHVLDRDLLGVATVSEVASTTLFLASDESRSITGQTISIDSGAGISFVDRKPAD